MCGDLWRDSGVTCLEQMTLAKTDNPLVTCLLVIEDQTKVEPCEVWRRRSAHNGTFPCFNDSRHR